MKKIFYFLTLLIPLVFSNTSFALGQDELLKPDIAFQASLTEISEDRIKATWKIADGYYLYRKRFSFKSDNPDITLGAPVFPKGKIKDDPGFGKVETYRHSVSIEIPITRGDSSNDPNTLSLKTKSQGCADIGVCYPPQKKTLTLKLKPIQLVAAKTKDTLSTIKTPNKALNLAQELGITTLGNTNAPLPPDKAFAFDITALDKKTLNAHWQITPGHYLYQHKIKFKLDSQNEGISLGKADLPKGKKEHDEYFGDIVTYNESFDVKIPVTGTADSITVKTTYQGCSKITGICYPPQHKTQTINLASAQQAGSQSVNTDRNAVSKAISDTANEPTNSAEKIATGDKVSEQDSIVNKMLSGNFLTILFSFFLAGVALTFTPCVFPMIPILSGIIAGQGSDNSTRKSFFLSLSYVLAMALTYAIVGVFAALSGENLQVALQNPWVIGAFAGLFVILSLAMFGFYELQMPAGIQSKITSISNSQSGGSMISAGIMGVLSALIVGPCVTAPLIGALIYIAETNDILLGGLSLFSLGLGMGVPLLIIGTSAGKILPKAGAWMDKVKAAFGIMMLALAIWMLERVVSPQIVLLLSGILAIFSGIYMGALDPLNEASTGWKRFFKSAGLIAVIYGALLLIGAASGNNSLLHPLKGSFSNSSSNLTSQQHLQFQPVKSLAELNQAISSAKQQRRTVMLDFYADWCISCKEMEHDAFSNKAVIDSLSNTIILQADVTANNDNDKALLKAFGLFGPPGILFFDKNGKENQSYRIVGGMKAKPFNDHVNQFLKNSE